MTLLFRAEDISKVAGVFCYGLIMAGSNARRLYDSKAWKDTRKAYTQSVGGLCERCMSKGIVTPAEVVHHKVPLTEDNANDTSVSLDWQNLQALCRKCHAEVHDEMYRERTGRRYKLDAYGRVIIC